MLLEAQLETWCRDHASDHLQYVISPKEPAGSDSSLKSSAEWKEKEKNHKEQWDGWKVEKVYGKCWHS